MHTLGQTASNQSSLHPIGMASPSLTSFNITDLLEKSIVQGSKDKAEKKMKQIIEFYKRQVKDETELKSTKEIIIKNYRLYVVRDYVKEGISAHMRSLFELNKGTSIAVNNSIVAPEKQRFSTSVTDNITKVYKYLNEDSPIKGKREFKPGQLNT